jgi:TfoX/Sxy family transcriptional regulator of competence genes
MTALGVFLRARRVAAIFGNPKLERMFGRKGVFCKDNIIAVEFRVAGQRVTGGSETYEAIQIR